MGYEDEINMSVEKSFLLPSRDGKVERSVNGSKRSERMIEKYEYRDKNGELICLAKVEFEQATEFDLLRNALEGGRLLKSLILENGNASIDILSLANKHGAVITILDSSDFDCYAVLDKEVLSHPLDSPLSIGVLLHELGHIEQYKDEYFIRLSKASESFQYASSNDFESKIENLREVGICDYLDPKLLAEFKILLDEFGEYSSDDYGLLGIDKRLDEVLAELDDVMIIATQVAERDATRRAILWLRQIKDRGIDLLQIIQTPFKATIAAYLLNQDSEDMMREKDATCFKALVDGLEKIDDDEFVNTTILQDLQLALRTTRSSTKEMKRSYGKIPKAKLNY